MLFNGCAIMRHHKITSEGRAKRLSASAGRSQNNIILQSHLAISSYCYILQLCLIIMSYILKLQLHLPIMSYNYVLQLQLHNEMWMWFLSFSPLLYSIVGHFLNKGQATQPGPRSWRGFRMELVEIPVQVLVYDLKICSYDFCVKYQVKLQQHGRPIRVKHNA